MNICVINLGKIEDCFISSVINQGLVKKYPDSNIDWLVGCESTKQLMSFSKNIRHVFLPSDQMSSYDLFINLTPFFHPSDPLVSNAQIIGFNTSDKKEFYDILYGNKKTKMNIFQVYFNLLDMTWRGEGFDIKYYPKNRQKKGYTGLLTSNINLRNFLKEKLELNKMKVSQIPFRKNIFKKMDEINRYEFVITDDWFSMNLSIALKKQVHYLKVFPINTKLEFFNNGYIYEIPTSVVR